MVIADNSGCRGKPSLLISVTKDERVKLDAHMSRLITKLNRIKCSSRVLYQSEYTYELCAESKKLRELFLPEAEYCMLKVNEMIECLQKIFIPEGMEITIMR